MIPRTVELINDGVHVHPTMAGGVARTAYPGRLALISDGVTATGAPDGRYQLDGVDIRSEGGHVRTADGRSLSGGGSTVTAACVARSRTSAWTSQRCAGGEFRTRRRSGYRRPHGLPRPPAAVLTCRWPSPSGPSCCGCVVVSCTDQPPVERWGVGA